MFVSFFLLWIGTMFTVYEMDLSNVQSAPQQAALAAMACVSLIFPYIVFRIFSYEATLQLQKRNNELLQRILEIQNLTEAGIKVKENKALKANEEKPRKKFITYWWKKPEVV